MYVLEEYALLKSIGCGGFTNMLQDAVVWFSSGGTKSVLHYDAVDNINCLFDGTKELLMINKVGLLYVQFIWWARSETKGCSRLDNKAKQ